MATTPKTYAEYRSRLPSTLTIADGKVNYKFKIPIWGDKVSDYADLFSLAQIWNLENFAATTYPTKDNQVIGQLGFDVNSKQLYVSSRSITSTDNGLTSISRPPLHDIFTNTSVVPKTTTVYDIGSETKKWADCTAKNMYVSDALYILKPTSSGYFNATDAFKVDSSKIYYNGTPSGSILVVNKKLDDVLNSLYDSAAGYVIRYLPASGNITPERDVLFINKRSSNLNLTLQLSNTMKLGETINISTYPGYPVTITLVAGVTVNNKPNKIKITEGAAFILVGVSATINSWAVSGEFTYV